MGVIIQSQFPHPPFPDPYSPLPDPLLLLTHYTLRFTHYSLLLTHYALRITVPLISLLTCYIVLLLAQHPRPGAAGGRGPAISRRWGKPGSASPKLSGAIHPTYTTTSLSSAALRSCSIERKAISLLHILEGCHVHPHFSSQKG